MIWIETKYQFEKVFYKNATFGLSEWGKIPNIFKSRIFPISSVDKFSTLEAAPKPTLEPTPEPMTLHTSKPTKKSK